MGFKEYCKAVGQNCRNTEVFQYIFSFTFGLAFGAVSLGLAWMIAFIIGYEILYMALTQGEYPYWRLYVRIVVNLISLIGWSLGRWIYLNINPFTDENCF